MLSFSLTSCHRPTSTATAPDHLTIGAPEDLIEGPDVGISNLARILSIESLWQLADDGRPVPKLAESWWWSNDGLRLNINLRPNILFHDGTALTAELAAQLLRVAVAKPSNRALFTSFADVQSVRAVGPRQLAIDLSEPSAFLPDDLEIPIERGNPADGTGPYRVVSRGPQQWVLERYQHYYLGTPEIARITIKPFDALRTAWTSLLRGDVDMVTDVPPDAVEFVSNEEVRVVSWGRRYQYLVALNLKKPPFDSPLVRRALNAAIDREALIKNALQGRGVPSTGPLWPKHWAYNNALPPYRFDPGLANAFLNSAGLRADKRSGGPPVRFSFTCLIPENFSVIERIALEVQKQLYDVGVDMQFEVIPIQDLDARIRAGRFDAMLIDSVVSGPTVGRSYLFWRSARRFPGGLNVFGYENQDAERLFDMMRTAKNEITIKSAFTRLQQTLLDDPPALFLAWNEKSRAVRREFQIVQDPRRDPADPLYTLWRWTTGPAEPTVALAR